MDIPAALLEKISTAAHPTLVGVSGFGGSGKSTFATKLGNVIHAPVISTDLFLTQRAQGNVTLWDCYDRERLMREVLSPFKNGEKSLTYGVYNWNADMVVGTQVCSTSRGVLIVEGIGLFQPSMCSLLDIKVWIECPLSVSLERGKRRDLIQGADHSHLWDGLWRENEESFFARYSPMDKADVIVENHS
ncbi:MAG: hypothetical protein RLZZ234_678 [Candidatus Parcubacteria bacterium]|jgi:uridine kinase